MSKKKPGVMLYFDMLPRLEKLTYEQCGRMMIAILKYGKSGIEPCFDDDILSIYWDFIKEKIDLDDEAYKRKCEKAKRAAAGRWDREREFNANECERMRTHTDACERIQTHANAYDGMQTDANGYERMRLMPTTTTPTTSTTTPSTTTPTTTNPTANQSSESDSIFDVPPVSVPHDAGLGETIDYFLNKINPTAPQYVLERITFYYKQMGADCCKRAFDIALAERKTSWSYIEAILKNKLSQGVRCLADWDDADKKREGEKRASEISRNQGKATAGDYQPTSDRIRENDDWLDRFLEETSPEWSKKGSSDEN